MLDIYRAFGAAAASRRHRVSLFADTAIPGGVPQHKIFAELEELAGLLRDKLQGRPVELVFPTFDDP